MKVACSLIIFRIDIDFPDADVDTVIAERWKASCFSPLAGSFRHKIIPGSITLHPSLLASVLNIYMDVLYGYLRKSGK